MFHNAPIPCGLQQKLICLHIIKKKTPIDALTDWNITILVH